MSARAIRALLLLAILPLSAYGAEVVVVSGDAPGVGFNNPTPAVPVGGNPGTTVGQQALNVFQRAASVWGAKLVSDQPIYVISFFTPLSCNATGAVLGAAGANWYFANIPAANGGKGLTPDTWYPAALAEKLTRQDIVADPDDPFEIFSVFNSELGKPGCLTGNGWYYGLDNREPSNRIDLLAVVLHEFGHGLGFSVGPTSASTGARAATLPSVWERYMLDASNGKRWIDMSNAERAASARNNLNLVWAGQKATNVIPSVLDFRAEVKVVDPVALGVNEVQTATFGPPLKTPPIQGVLVAPGGTSPGTADGCAALTDPSIPGNIVLIRRGTCPFTQKVLNAQNAGARAVLIDNNQAGLPGMGGADPTIRIVSLGISQALGNALRAALPTTYVRLQRNPLIRMGTTSGYTRLYAPTLFAGGSSVSHWDTSATPNMLMEPFINTDLTSSVKNPDDLTRSLFFDIGW